MLCVSLIACGPGPILEVARITVDPEVGVKGEIVVFKVAYVNNSQESSYDDVRVVIRYDPYLTFDRDAIPFPDEIRGEQRELEWNLGTLAPQEEGELQMFFRLAQEIPTSVYGLEVAAELSSASAEGGRTQHDQAIGSALIQGHKTPTPLPTNTPRPATSTPVVTPMPPP